MNYPQLIQLVKNESQNVSDLLKADLKQARK